MLRSLDPDEQSVEERAALFLGDPLDLRVAEARIQGLTVAESLRSNLIGAGTDAHLESHLSVVAAVRAGVLKSAGGPREVVSTSLLMCRCDNNDQLKMSRRPYDYYLNVKVSHMKHFLAMNIL